MNEQIGVALAEIERTEHVRVLYAVESGSRAWGFPSRDSDDDVRFIYVRPVGAYLTIQPPCDVIERPISDALDINGWDLPKALGLFRRSNPALLERLRSPSSTRSDSISRRGCAPSNRHTSYSFTIEVT